MNEKRLIFGIFRPVDLVIFMSGVFVTFILLILFTNLENANTLMMIIATLPVLICAILVMPLKNHHNVLEAIKHNIKK